MLYIYRMSNKASNVPKQGIHGSKRNPKNLRETPGLPGELQGSRRGFKYIRETPGIPEGGSRDPRGIPGDPRGIPASRDPTATPANDGLYRNYN